MNNIGFSIYKKAPIG